MTGNKPKHSFTDSTESTPPFGYYGQHILAIHWLCEFDKAPLVLRVWIQPKETYGDPWLVPKGAYVYYECSHCLARYSEYDLDNLERGDKYDQDS